MLPLNFESAIRSLPLPFLYQVSLGNGLPKERQNEGYWIRNMIEVTETETHFLRMLADAEVDIVKPSVREVWQIFKSFSVVAVNCANDALLFQSGIYDFTGREWFYLDFVRQFGFEDEAGEHDHFEQLHCEFLYEPGQVLRNLETNLWSFQCDSFNDFFERVEKLEDFRVPIAEYSPAKVNVMQEYV